MSAPGRARPRGRRRATLAAAVLLALAGACAKVGPPPGGPEDRDPPRIESTAPGDGAAAVAPDSAVVLVFSERPDHRSVMRALRVIPPVDFRETRWDEATLTLRPEGGWARERATLLRIGTTAKDRRGNALEEEFALRFTTRAAPDTGAVTGRVWLGREAGRGAVAVVVALAADADSAAGPESLLPYAIAIPDRRGIFRLEGLDTARAWRIVGLLDRDGDTRAESRGEARGEAPEPVAFRPPDREVAVPDFLVGTLDSVGSIAGDVLVDSAAVAVVEAFPWVEGAEGEAVAPLPFAARAVLPGGGAFTLDVPTGATWRVAAFADTDGDTTRSPDERWLTAEEPAGLALTATVRGLSFDLRSPPDTTGADALPAPDAPVRPPDGAEGGGTEGAAGGEEP